MREIKFRAWDTSMGRMDHFNLGETVPYYYPDENSPSVPYDVMQFTGLHDKNGREIYEGDVVRIFADSLNGEQVTVVKWREEGFWEYFNGFENCEVIGNIYENPELLS